LPGADLPKCSRECRKEFPLGSNYFSGVCMVKETQFRKALPALQTAIAISFGGWGLWLRNSILSRPFWGSAGWNSTAVFHIWPWPFKFAAILNMPAVLAGGLLSLPFDYLRPGMPEWVSVLPVLLLVPLLWYWLGSWADRIVRTAQGKISARQWWIWIMLFMFLCAVASSIPPHIGGETSYVPFGIAIWMVFAVGVQVSGARNRKSKVA
jgi:hypothetical protein